MASLAAEEGRIGLALRVGVTGHRWIVDTPELLAIVRDALARIRCLVPVSSVTPLVPVVVSALAEGADRLVAREVLREEGARLEAMLPLEPDEYLRDFETEGSKREFRALLSGSSEVRHPSPSSTREEAYATAGRGVVDRCDVLLALWDGEPSEGGGGTGEIVAYARSRRVPLIWVKTADEPSMIEELDAPRVGVIAEAAHELDLYNRSRISPGRLHAQAEIQRAHWGLPAEPERDRAAEPLPRADVAVWLLPHLARADILALRFQRRFKAMSSAVFLMATAAVAVVAIQTTFFSNAAWVVALEAAFLLGVLLILWLSRRWRLHDRWISCRFMAERLRSLYFLTLAGIAGRHDGPTGLAYFTDPSEVWIGRALVELTARRPRVGRSPPVDPLRDYLAEHWISDQVRYHGKAARDQHGWDTRLARTTAVLFALTLVASILHMLGVGGHGEPGPGWGALLVVLAILLPVTGAAAHGIGTQRQFRRHSERYGRMAGLLEQLVAEMRQARTLEAVQRAAAETERIMREENSDWFGVMRFHDIELIT